LIVLPWVKLGFIGAHAGLALATALAGYINAGLLFYQLRKQQIYQFQATAKKRWLIDLARVLVSIIVMAGLIWFVNPTDAWWQSANLGSKVGTLLLLVLISIVAYFVSLFAMGIRKKHFTA